MKFILYLFLMNVILALPRYLFGLPRNWNPLRFIMANETLSQKAKTNDSTLFLTAVSVVIFVFNIYIAVFLVLLKKTPVLRSDWFFIRESISIYKGYFLLIITLFFIIIALFFYGFLFLNSYYEHLVFNKAYAFLFVILLLANGLYNVHRYNLTDYLARVVISLFIFIFKSRAQTKKYNNLFSLTDAEIEGHNLFSKVSLSRKPNIHIISMESYGSVLFKNKEQYKEVVDTIENWDKLFKNSDINCFSSFALPPLFATGTWYSYSTLLFGMKIDNGAVQNILFSEMSNFDKYQSLFQFTKKEGYTNFLVQGMIGEFEGTLDFDKLKKNLNYDRLIYNKELDYDGQLLKFMNLQNCVPDQYSFNKGLNIAKESKKPYTMFFCTLNSHWDFYSPIHLAENWKDLSNSDSSFVTTSETDSNRTERYKYAIKYTIDSVFDTILKRMTEDDIYIVYGDHQPTMITDEKYGKETPFHIFSRNKDFVKLWEQYGFKEGLIPEDNERPMKFEAFYSAFMKSINKIYGEDTHLDIPYMKDGVSFIE